MTPLEWNRNRHQLDYLVRFDSAELACPSTEFSDITLAAKGSYEAPERFFVEEQLGSTTESHINVPPSLSSTFCIALTAAFQSSVCKEKAVS